MRKNVFAALAGMAVAGVVAASAASLGQVNAQSEESDIVEVPVNDRLTILWQSEFDRAAGHRVVSDFTLEATGDDELPEGAAVTVMVTGADLDEALEGTVVFGGSIVFDGDMPAIPADAVKGVAVRINGGADGELDGEPEAA